MNTYLIDLFKNAIVEKCVAKKTDDTGSENKPDEIGDNGTMIEVNLTLRLIQQESFFYTRNTPRIFTNYY